jgi:hypothetical protein
MYIVIVFSFLILYSSILISQLYEPIIPACTNLLCPPFTAFFLDIFGF